MLYNDFCGEKVSFLGMGGMRFPQKDNKIDEEKTAEMIEYAINNGVNYFDTAWGYHGGESETVLGKLLQKYERKSFFLTSKFPGYDTNNMEHVKDIFEKQLEKCRTDYFDFYLFHNVCEKNIDLYLDEKYGILEYLLEQKEKGRIRHLGFSVHANNEDFVRFLNRYGKYMEFCQIQLNYLDWEFQLAKEKVRILNEMNIPIIVMEPVRGGKLINLTNEQKEYIESVRADETPASFGFRFVASVKGVKLVLSGMSDIEQLKDNIRTFSVDKRFNENEFEKAVNLGKLMVKDKTVPCTACRYCTSYCPKGIDIPTILGLFNEHNYSGGGFIAPMRLEVIDKEKWPTACIGCRSCEAVCPQNIEISLAMKDFSKIL